MPRFGELYFCCFLPLLQHSRNLGPTFQLGPYLMEPTLSSNLHWWEKTKNMCRVLPFKMNDLYYCGGMQCKFLNFL